MFGLGQYGTHGPPASSPCTSLKTKVFVLGVLAFDIRDFDYQTPGRSICKPGTFGPEGLELSRDRDDNRKRVSNVSLSVNKKLNFCSHENTTWIQFRTKR